MMVRTTTLVALLAVAAPSWAQPDDETQKAKALFKQAEVHFSLGEFDKALPLYKEAYKVKALPAFLFNLGQCHRNMGQCDKALFFFKQYLVRLPDAPNKADVEKLITICEAEVEKAKAPEPPKPEPPTTTKPEPAGETKPVASGEVEHKPDPKPEPVPRRRGIKPLWFWSGVGLAGALLVTGTVTGVVALSKSDEYKDLSTKVDRRRDLKDAGETLRTVSTATIIAGGVTAAAAGVLFFMTDWGGATDETSVSAAPLLGGAGVVVEGRF